MKSKRRIIGIITASALILTVALSVLFIAYEADHDCAGEACPVCMLVRECAVSITACAVSTVTFVYVCRTRTERRDDGKTPVHGTPVSLAVKLTA